MKIQPGDAEKTVRAFFHAYLEKRNLEETAAFLCEGTQWIGTGKLEMAYDKQDVLRLLQDELATEGGPYFVTLENVGETIFNDICAVLICDLKVAPADIPLHQYFLRARVTATCISGEEGCRIVSIHASIATDLQEEGEYFPLAFADEVWIELLEKNIPGGMMAGYLEPGYPLYFVNDQMLHYLGYTRDEFVQSISGKVINCMHPDDRARVEAVVSRSFETHQEYEVQYRMLKRDGSYIWVNDIGRMSTAEDGRRICMSTIRDISAEVEAQKKLKAEIIEKQKQAQRYDHLFQSVLCGIVQYQLTDGTAIEFKAANKEAIRIFGYEMEDFWRKKDWDLANLIAEEDRERVLAGTFHLNKLGVSRSFEYKVRRKDGGTCWIIGSAEVIRNPDGEILIQSVFLDIDNSKKAELQNQRLSRQVEAGNELLKTALEHTSTCEFYYYPQKRLCVMPERTCAYYQCRPCYYNMPYLFAEEFAAKDYRQSCEEIFIQIAHGEKTASTEFQKKGGNVWCRLTISIIGYTEENLPSYAVGIIEDITREKEMSLALQDARSRDRLTGLYTKEAGIDMIHKFMNQKDARQACCMMILDLDGFHRINREEGTVFADAILQDVAGVLRAETSEDDIQIRVGGDEFMLFVKNCDKKHAVIIGPRICNRVHSIYGGENRNIPISVSIGMCSTEVVDDYSGLYRCAESALLYVKEHGKGRAACYLDTSNEIGTALTQIYTNEHLFNEIDSQGVYRTEDMVDFALELLGKSKKLDDAIFLLLARIGIRYGFDRVSIIEANPDYLSLRYSYQWAKNRADLLRNKEIYLSRESYEELPALYDADGLCETPFPNGSFSMPFCLQAAVWNQGTYAGALIFERCSLSQTWTDEERRLAKEITKLIASFVMKARADAVSQAKSEFLSRMSHEIRTPMNAISGMTTIAKSVMEDREKLLDCLEKIESANEYLLGLINDILVMSRIESGKMELNYESARLDNQLRKLEELMSPQAVMKNVSLHFENRCGFTRPLSMDVLRFNQVMINIIGNAIKFTPAKGNITVLAQPLETAGNQVRVRFSVKDTGIGIHREALGRIFNVFEQEGSNTSTQYGGTGLGLSISCRLVQMMGGTLAVESEPGRGSEFYFTLPFPISDMEPDEQNQAERQGGNPQDACFQGKRLLLAEDNELNREIAVSILKMHGFLVDTAENGDLAVKMYLAHDVRYYSAILMDIRMPVMDGLAATRSIRISGKEDARVIPIIAMTANAFDEDSKKSLESGMNGHITKPIDVSRLMDLLRKNLI